VEASVDPDGWKQSVEFVVPDELKARPLADSESLYLERGLHVLASAA